MGLTSDSICFEGTARRYSGYSRNFPLVSGNKLQTTNKLLDGV